MRYASGNPTCDFGYLEVFIALCKADSIVAKLGFFLLSLLDLSTEKRGRGFPPVGAGSCVLEDCAENVLHRLLQAMKYFPL